MSARKHALAIYGASGFTGSYILEELVKSSFGNIKFAIAGRNEQKLRATLKRVSEYTGRDLSNTPIIIASTDQPESLDRMAKECGAIVNAVGPHRVHGEPVIRAAAANGTHHVDISGEPAWQERMVATYGDKAKETGACIVNGCGLGSIPVDLGLVYLRNKFPGIVSHAESFAALDMRAGYSANEGSYQTILLSMAASDELAPNRQRIMPQNLKRTHYEPPKRSYVWYNKELQSYAIAFPGGDKEVVNRSQYYEATMNKRYPVSIETYMLQPNVVLAVLAFTWFGMMSVLCKSTLLLSIFQRFPLLVSAGNFSSTGPTREQVKKASFTIYVKGYGWSANVQDANRDSTEPSEQMTIRCDGPDAGYIGTARCALGAAITLLEDTPSGGGVFTPAVAFEKTKIFENLDNLGITFRVHGTK